jgi:8-oxo-dGTP pyrophosphatase MutT (NUDIX family)
MPLPAAPIEISARLVVLTQDRVLLANRRGQSWYFLPGGNVEPGESVEAALRRETDEETGLNVRDLEFLGCAEHVYVADGTHFHEVNVLFAAALPWGAEIGSRENDIDIVSVSLWELPGLELRPATLTALILDWVNNHRPRWEPAPPDAEPGSRAAGLSG